MREILFRGQSVKTNEWVTGHLIVNSPLTYIINPAIESLVTVYSYTVGQYTGLLDKNGKKIFEGDIVRLTDPTGKCVPDEGEFIETIYFADGMWISSEKETNWQDESIHRCAAQGAWEYEVIGNTHDIPTES